jgi:hypothetical protein
VRQRNWLNLMLPVGLAAAALCLPVCVVWSEEWVPTAIQAALRVGPGEPSPHFFTGDSRLSSFQKLPEPISHPLQSAAVTAVPAPNVGQQLVEQPSLVIAPTGSNALANVEPALINEPFSETPVSNGPMQPVVWDDDKRLDPHFFPNKSVVGLASYQQPAAEPAPSSPPAPRLRPAGIQTVGAAQVAIAPPQPPVPPAVPPTATVHELIANVSAPRTSIVQALPSETLVPIAAAAFSEPDAQFPPPASHSSVAVAPQVPHPEPPPPELTAPKARLVAFDNKRLRDPHFFAGTLRLAPLERQSSERATNLQAPPLKEAVVQSAAAPNLPPAAEVALPAVAAAPRVVAPQPTSLLMPSPTRLNPTAIAELPPPSPTLAPALTNLVIPDGGSTAPLVPAAVFPAATPAPLREQVRLTSLQQLPAPGANLQPTEVLPIPTPQNPAGPRVPLLDADRPIGAVTASISDPSGRMPTDLAIERFRGDYPAYLPRDWEDSVYFWDAPSMCIRPLRYEEVNLERFGYSHCPAIQPVLSGMHFLVATMALPYSFAAHPPGTCIYPLGHYRPGSPVPFRHIRREPRPWPISAECMAVAGLILLIP